MTRELEHASRQIETDRARRRIHAFPKILAEPDDRDACLPQRRKRALGRIEEQREDLGDDSVWQRPE